jgi:hypothetical protein
VNRVASPPLQKSRQGRQIWPLAGFVGFPVLKHWGTLQPATGQNPWVLTPISGHGSARRQNAVACQAHAGAGWVPVVLMSPVDAGALANVARTAVQSMGCEPAAWQGRQRRGSARFEGAGDNNDYALAPGRGGSAVARRGCTPPCTPTPSARLAGAAAPWLGEVARPPCHLPHRRAWQGRQRRGSARAGASWEGFAQKMSWQWRQRRGLERGHVEKGPGQWHDQGLTSNRARKDSQRLRGPRHS